MTFLLCVVCLMLVPLSAAGLALIHQGLGRSRSAAHAMIGALCATGIAAIVFVMLGFAFAGYAGGPSHVISAAGVRWDWIGAEPLFAKRASLGTDDPMGYYRSLVLCLEMFAAGLAATIPLSGGADRWRLSASCVASGVLAGFLFPIFTHWAWGGGWLNQLGTTFGLARFIDAGGAGVVQVIGGFMAVSVVWITGPRRGKFASDGMPAAIPGHNIVLVLFGCLLALVGWSALESATSILFYQAQLETVVWIIINTMLAAASGALTALVLTRARYRKPDASLTANGWIGGLVAVSASCGFVSPVASIFIGAVAGGLVTYMIEVAELRLQADDPGGSVSVHAGAGIWGLIAVGVFGRFPDGSLAMHLLAQLVGVASLLGFMLPIIFGVNLLIDRFVRYRVDSDGDWQGMDIRELGAGAYPEFVVHADEFVPR